MARENLPRISSTLTDGNLDTSVSTDLGDSILLIGTADRGPDSNPVRVTDLQTAIDLFGTQGTLTEGYAEALFAPGGAKDIRLMRISNGEKAAIDIVEQSTPDVVVPSGSVLDETTDVVSGNVIPALRLEALYPGSVYNSVSIQQVGADIVRLYNPITDTSTDITYSTTGAANSVADVKELADAINVDPNMGSVVEATANRIRTVFEIDVHDDWSYATVAANSISIDLKTALEDLSIYVATADQDPNNNVDYPSTTGDSENDSFTLTAASINAAVVSIGLTHASDITDVATVWPTEGYVKLYKAVGDEEEEVEIVKFTSVVSLGANTMTIAGLTRGFGGTTAQIHAQADTTAELYLPLFPVPVNVTSGNQIDELVEVYALDDVIEELDGAGLSAVSLDYPVQLTTGLARPLMDVSNEEEDTTGDGIAILLVRNSYIATGDGTETVFEFTAYEEIDPAELQVFRTSSAGTTVEIDAADFTLDSAGGDLNDSTAQITFAAAISNGSLITVSYDSLGFQMTQLATLASASASTSYREYFMAGDQITFGTALPADIKIMYRAKVNYKVGSEVVANDSVISISVQGITATSKTIIGIDYYYQPEWLDLSGGAVALQGGTNGITMSNKEKYSVLADAYVVLADYAVDMIVPLNTNLDDTKIQYDPETGLPVEVNAGFAQQLSTFLETLQDGVDETFGIISVNAPDSFSLSDINTWYDKLVTVSAADPLRAANVMDSLNARLLDVLAINVLITNAVSGLVNTNAAALVAGLTSQLEPHSATTNKSLGGQIQALSFPLSSRQLNELTGKRYVTAKLRLGGGDVVVTDGVTAAELGSDWTRRTSYRIAAAAISIIREVGQPFIGEGFSPAKKAALDTAISKGLFEMQQNGALISYNYAIKQTPAEFATGSARINLVIQPAFELRRIAVTVSLSATDVG